MHLEDAIDFIPYGTMVDEFQHIVYGNPEMTPKERRDAWKQAGERVPSVPGWHRLQVPGRWTHTGRDSIIFLRLPFYYIDYVLAQLCAIPV